MGEQSYMLIRSLPQRRCGRATLHAGQIPAPGAVWDSNLARRSDPCPRSGVGEQSCTPVRSLSQERCGRVIWHAGQILSMLYTILTPLPELRSIHELVLHATYKISCRRVRNVGNCRAAACWLANLARYAWNASQIAAVQSSGIQLQTRRVRSGLMSSKYDFAIRA